MKWMRLESSRLFLQHGSIGWCTFQETKIVQKKSSMCNSRVKSVPTVWYTVVLLYLACMIVINQSTKLLTRTTLVEFSKTEHWFYLQICPQQKRCPPVVVAPHSQRFDSRYSVPGFTPGTPGSSCGASPGTQRTLMAQQMTGKHISLLVCE